MRTEIDRQTIPPNLLPQVERLAEHLEDKLQVFESYDIEAKWNGSVEDGVPIVLLRMGALDNEGVMRWAEDTDLVPSFFEDSDESMRWWVGRVVFRFIDHLSAVSRENLRRLQERLRRMEPVTAEA